MFQKIKPVLKMTNVVLQRDKGVPFIGRDSAPTGNEAAVSAHRLLAYQGVAIKSVTIPKVLLGVTFQALVVLVPDFPNLAVRENAPNHLGSRHSWAIAASFVI